MIVVALRTAILSRIAFASLNALLSTLADHLAGLNSVCPMTEERILSKGPRLTNAYFKRSSSNQNRVPWICTMYGIDSPMVARKTYHAATCEWAITSWGCWHRRW